MYNEPIDVALPATIEKINPRFRADLDLLLFCLSGGCLYFFQTWGL